MSKGKNAIEIIAFLVIFLIIFWQVQEIVSPDWDWPEENYRVATSVSGVYAEPTNSLDILWLGTSHMQCGVAPMLVYQNTGVHSYNLATTMQSMALSYGRLKTAFQKQKPKVVFLDVSSLYFSKNNVILKNIWKQTIESIPWNAIADRLYIFRIYYEVLQEICGSADISVFDCLLPIIQNHYSINDLDFDDYSNVIYEIPSYRKGHTLQSEIAPAWSYWAGNWDDLRTEYIRREKDSQLANEEYVSSCEQMQENLAYNLKWLDEIQILCNENECELVLVKIPVNASPTQYSGYWNMEKHQGVIEVASERGLEFIDLNYEEVNIDWNTDTMDYGVHLNELGAIKVSQYMSNYISEKYNSLLKKNRKDDASWLKDLEAYEIEQNYCLLQLDEDVEHYLWTVRTNGYSILLAVSDTLVGTWTDDKKEMVSKLTGINEDYLCLDHEAYVGYFDNGSAIYEENNALSCEYSGTLSNGTQFTLSSKGWYEGGGASICIGDEKYDTNDVGLQIVVYDRKLGCVIDVSLLNVYENTPFILKENKDYKEMFYKSLLDFLKEKF
ncbi:MAG: hypothetical protein Q4E13_02230 [Clostridia bacterium]|nr:hypothetical protein [Clostridia bacterium]